MRSCQSNISNTSVLTRGVSAKPTSGRNGRNEHVMVLVDLTLCFEYISCMSVRERFETIRTVGVTYNERVEMTS